MKGSEILGFKDELALVLELVVPVPSGARVDLGLHGVFNGRDWGGSAWPELLLLLLCGGRRKMGHLGNTDCKERAEIFQER